MLKIKLAIDKEFKCNRKVIGFDIDDERLEELSKGFDRTNELSKNDIKAINSLILSHETGFISR